VSSEFEETSLEKAIKCIININYL